MRGVHPPVLSDRGLDAALSGLAAICPVPVTVKVEIGKRPSATVEAVAYFVVAEAADQCRQALWSGERQRHCPFRGRHVLQWSCATTAAAALPTGAGLAGLADRVQAVDGRLSMTAPPAARP